jgi:CMP-N,N'-diacetyllegionaminic acid synthase
MNESGDILIVIPARGGSKRLPRKNVLPLAGKPLICWTIESALDTNINARIIVTSDDEEILEITRSYACRGVIAHRRPAELATDTASTTDTLIDAINADRRAGLQPKTLLLLQPTSPLRNADDICAALKIYREGDCGDTVVSVCEVDHPSAWTGVIGERAAFTGIDLSGNRSQDYQQEYRLNGAVYVVSIDVLMTKNTLFTDQLRASVMPRGRSFDIDVELDFRICGSLVDRG